MDTILFQRLNNEDQVDKALLDLVKKGYVEYAICEKTGELLFSLTDKGQQACNELYGEEVD